MLKTPFALLATILLLFAAAEYGCRHHSSADRILAETVEKISLAPALQYEYRSRWDNRFNGTIYSDSAEVVRWKAEGSPHGFGFYVVRSGNTFLFDGVHYREIRPAERLIVHHDPEEIRRDTAYFSDLIFFTCSPSDLKYPGAFDRIKDSVTGQRHLLVCRERSEMPSVSDTSKTITRDRYFYVDADRRLPERVLTCSTLDGDTLQILDYRFTAFGFDKEPFDLRRVDTTSWSAFTEMSIHDLEDDRRQSQIAKGDRLEQSVHNDLNGNPIRLFGRQDRQTLIMFSFIGCGGCEYVVRELKNANYKIREGLDFYYSSPVDSRGALKSYLEKKAFPFIAFSAESGMNEAFSIYAYPTFVLLEPDGKVAGIWTGFEDAVKEILLAKPD